MAQTNIPSGSDQARVAYSVALFAEITRKSTFQRNLTGPAPMEAQALSKARQRGMQTDHQMPFVRITDLTKDAGDTVKIDMFGALTGYSIMGDRKASGSGEPLKLYSQDIKIDQHRKVANPGGRMTRKRVRWQLRNICKANLVDWFSRYIDQQCLVHVCGARGTDNSVDWLIPPQGHEELNDILVNPLLTPTRNRRYLAGDATGFGDIDIQDALTLEDIDKLRVSLAEMPLPPSKCVIPGDPMGVEEPVWIMYVTARQWHYIETTAKANGNDWRTFLANATRRASMSKHPLFRGGAGIWNGILVKVTDRAVRFAPNVAQKEYNAAGAEVDATPTVPVDRAFLLGSQALGDALGDAMGDNSKGGLPVSWDEEETDLGNMLEIAGRMMGGKSKLRFTGTDGARTDFGAAVMDTYSPNPATPAGAALRSHLSS